MARAVCYSCCEPRHDSWELTSSPPVKLDVDAMQRGAIQKTSIETRKSKDKESKTPRFEPGLKPVDVKPTDAKRPGQAQQLEEEEKAEEAT